MQNYKIIITRNTSIYTFYNLCFALVKDMEVDTQVVRLRLIMCLSLPFPTYVPDSLDICLPFVRCMSYVILIMMKPVSHHDETSVSSR